MSVFEAFILGVLQGLTEFLPVSSSGHLEIGQALLGVSGEGNLLFTTAVHGGTVLSTIVVFRKELARIITGFFKFKANAEMRFVVNVAVSMLPLVFVGFFFKDQIEALFTGNLTLVGVMLLVTAALLTFSHYAKPRTHPLTMKDAFIIGIAQAIAVFPGLSRSGSTISTGLLLGVKREEVAPFSFLMVLIPIIGINLLDLMHGDFAAAGGISGTALAVGFLAAFVTGTLACQAMVNLVKRGKLLWFAVYCTVIGAAAIVYSLF